MSMRFRAGRAVPGGELYMSAYDLATCSLAILALPSSLAGANAATARALPATVAVETGICITRQ
jgi:hypothetical protein